VASYIKVGDGRTYRLLPEVDPAELTVQIATALEGGDSVTVGVEPPLGGEQTAALVIGRGAPCVLLSSDAE